MNDDLVAKVMRAIYAVGRPDFEDVGQPISQMRFLAKHREMHLEAMARAAISAVGVDGQQTRDK